MKAPEFPSHLPWLNTARPLSLVTLKGHVVLLDFWTYCCINCLHVLPDLAWLEEKYKDEPFVVIGVHAAKFNNEKDMENIQHAIQRYEIEHPVLVDNEHWVWQLYTVKAWPTFVLIGPDGKIIGMTSGEGKRELLDKYISRALEEGRQNGTLVSQKINIQRPPRPKRLLAFPGKLEYGLDNGRLYVSDSNHHRILELEVMEKGRRARIARVIGSGQAGRDDGAFSSASFYRPQGMAYHDGKLYVCDTDNHLIREVDLLAETVRTIAGTGEQGKFGERGGQALEVRLNSPWDAVVEGDSLYIAMAGPHQLWRLHFPTNKVDVFAGNGWESIWDGPAHEANLAQPSGISSDGKWLYFADSETSALRRARIVDGQVETLVGSGLFDFGLEDGPFPAAQLQHPLGVAYHAGKVYVADTYNHAVRVAHLEEEYMETLIFRPVKNVCAVGDALCGELPLNEPNDVLVIGDVLYIADTNNHLIRTFDLQTRELGTLEIEV
jgi:thiol-disulfide isomerase/thioredoxin